MDKSYIIKWEFSIMKTNVLCMILYTAIWLRPPCIYGKRRFCFSLFHKDRFSSFIYVFARHIIVHCMLIGCIINPSKKFIIISVAWCILFPWYVCNCACIEFTDCEFTLTFFNTVDDWKPRTSRQTSPWFQVLSNVPQQNSRHHGVRLHTYSWLRHFLNDEISICWELATYLFVR